MKMANTLENVQFAPKFVDIRDGFGINLADNVPKLTKQFEPVRLTVEHAKVKNGTNVMKLKKKFDPVELASEQAKKKYDISINLIGNKTTFEKIKLEPDTLTEECVNESSVCGVNSAINVSTLIKKFESIKVTPENVRQKENSIKNLEFGNFTELENDMGSEHATGKDDSSMDSINNVTRLENSSVHKTKNFCTQQMSGETLNVFENLVDKRQRGHVKFEDVVKVIDKNGLVFDKRLKAKHRSKTYHRKSSRNVLPRDLTSSSKLLPDDSESKTQNQIYYFDGTDVYAVESSRVEISARNHYVVIVDKSIPSAFIKVIGKNNVTGNANTVFEKCSLIAEVHKRSSSVESEYVPLDRGQFGSVRRLNDVFKIGM